MDVNGVYDQLITWGEYFTDVESFNPIDLAMNQYIWIPFVGGYSHPLTSYFDVYQGFDGFWPIPVDETLAVKIYTWSMKIKIIRQFLLPSKYEGLLYISLSSQF